MDLGLFPAKFPVYSNFAQIELTTQGGRNRQVPSKTFGRGVGEFLLRKVQKRAVRQPPWVAFTALSHLDDVSGEDRAARGRVSQRL